MKSSYLGIVLLLPALHEGGLLDHWPAWSVYSASAARVHVLINKEAVSLLPDECLLHVQDRGVGDGWQRLRLDRWSLHAVDAPIYPDARFQLAVAASILTDLPAGSWVVVLESQAGRLSGERTREKAASNAELRSILRRYWINTTVRSSDRRHQ